ncbi:MAG: MvdD family ATP-grasp ribosomal peptide maturase [Acidobacteriota bacterium]
MTVLIITKSDDNESIDFVTDSIKERGGTVFRFDTDRFPTEIRLIAQYSKTRERLTLADKEAEFDLNDLSAVWYRRLNVAGKIPTTIAPDLRNTSLLESRTTVLGFIASIKAFHLDQIRRVQHANNKQLQLQVAREFGLETPRTLITNSPEAVREFANTCENGVITKMLSSFAIYENGMEKVVFTNPLTAQDLEDLDGLRFCPMTFQERVPKRLELRVTIVGNRIFAASIDSQSFERARDDWRRDGVAMVNEWKPYELPPEVEEKLLKLMDYFGLNYGAIDIILTPDGRHIFLEINPAGEFFWLEKSPGLPISKTLAEVLLGLLHRRS